MTPLLLRQNLSTRARYTFNIFLYCFYLEKQDNELVIFLVYKVNLFPKLKPLNILLVYIVFCYQTGNKTTTTFPPMKTIAFLTSHDQALNSTTTTTTTIVTLNIESTAASATTHDIS